ncbi:thiamine-phosphate kinase [Falsiroseomonas sp. HW251]|uniref:thiamine-phosphate kinase n=1 Tax=Falsiroseomonas sp. HW251 TaxID=3390998 RepID=UPI003D313D83
MTTDDLPPEFSLIARHFRPLAGPGSLGLSDDAALLDLPPGQQLVLAADAIVEGVHFLADDPPETIGRKLLRTNLSDLAAMGATPLGYLMTCAFPKGTPDDWIARFAAGLAEDQRAFRLHLLGGDTVATPGPASFSLTIVGSVEPGRALRRQGAKPGDELWVSGTIGDGALGLLSLTGGLPPDPELAERYRLPRPRLALGRALAGIAAAAMDVSDGLVQDLGHLARAGGCAAVIEAASVPLSDPARAALAADPGLLARILAGGDDYELLFAAPPGEADRVLEAARATQTPVSRIGRFMDGSGVVVLDGSGAEIPLPRGGWSHFG